MKETNNITLRQNTVKPSSLQPRSISGRKLLVVLKYKNFAGLKDEMSTH